MNGLVLGAWVLLASSMTSAGMQIPPVYFETREACEEVAKWRSRHWEFRCFPTGAAQ